MINARQGLRPYTRCLQSLSVSKVRMSSTFVLALAARVGNVPVMRSPVTRLSHSWHRWRDEAGTVLSIDAAQAPLPRETESSHLQDEVGHEPAPVQRVPHLLNVLLNPVHRPPENLI
jgi:hypothetical protein